MPAAAQWGAWLAAQHFTASPVQAAYESAYEPVVMAEDRHARLDRAIAVMARDPAWSPVVANVAIARELADWCWSLATMPD